MAETETGFLLAKTHLERNSTKQNNWN